MRRPSSLSALLMVVTAAVLLPAAVNVATGALPAGWRPFLWLAWPLALVLAVPVAVMELRRGKGPSVAGGTDASTPGETLWNIPPRLATFTEREPVLEEIHQILGKPAAGPVVLTGWPGVGKTQVAAAYAAAHRAEYDIGWWIAADSRLAVIASLAQLADRLRIGDEDQEESARKALRSLAGRGRWLLVLDNVTGEEDLSGLIAAESGHVLMTSRDPGLARLGTVVTVEPFDTAVAERFLLKRADSTDRTAAARLAVELGGLPLALEQAGAYCAKAYIDLDGYLALYREHHDRLLRQGSPPGRKPVHATLDLAIRQVYAGDRAAVQLLRLCSVLASSASIPRWLVASHPGLLPSPLRNALEVPLGLGDTVPALISLSLVQTTGDQLRIHPVVQDVVHDQLTADGWGRRFRTAVESWRPAAGADRAARWSWERWVRLAAEVVGAALPADPAQPEGWDHWVAALPHALRVADHADGITSAATGALRHRIGAYLLHRGELSSALEMLETAITELTSTVGRTSAATLTARNDRARVLVDQGRLEEGGRAHEEVLAARLAALGPHHRDTLASMNNVAFAWARLGRLDDARRRHEETLLIRQRVLGPEHPDSLISMGNLALVLAEQGELAQARRLHEQSLAMRRAVLGDRHPAVLVSMNNLAIVVSDLGDLDQARQLHQHTLGVRQELFGDDHPETLMSVNNLAFVLALQGDLDKALDLHERTLAARRRVSGPEHPHTLISMNNLGLVLASQGHTARARALHEQTLAVRRRVLGGEHPYTLHSENNLALVLAAQGEPAAAGRLIRSTLAVRERTLGPRHPDTLTSMSNLALVYAAGGHLDQAHDLLTRVLAARRQVLGAGHPHTLTSVKNLTRVTEALPGTRPVQLIPEPS
jgi:tetratricopeptide (TPR) repeat protein